MSAGQRAPGPHRGGRWHETTVRRGDPVRRHSSAGRGRVRRAAGPRRRRPPCGDHEGRVRSGLHRRPRRGPGTLRAARRPARHSVGRRQRDGHRLGRHRRVRRRHGVVGRGRPRRVVLGRGPDGSRRFVRDGGAADHQRRGVRQLRERRDHARVPGAAVGRRDDEHVQLLPRPRVRERRARRPVGRRLRVPRRAPLGERPVHARRGARQRHRHAAGHLRRQPRHVFLGERQVLLRRGRGVRGEHRRDPLVAVGHLDRGRRSRRPARPHDVSVLGLRQSGRDRQDRPRELPVGLGRLRQRVR